MKKLLAILLGAALVLSLSGVASAALTVTGAVEFTFTTAGGWDYEGLTKAETKLKLANAWGQASGDITTIIKKGLNYGGTAATINIDTANFKYVLSDALSIGATHKYGGKTTLPGPVDQNFGFKVYGADVFVNDYKAIEESLMMATYAFDGGSVKFYTADLDNFYGVVAYDGDPIDVGAWLLYGGGGFRVLGEVEYTFANGIELEGGINYTNGDVYTGADIDVGVQVGYTTDTMELEGGIVYDVDGGLQDYYAEATVGIMDNLNLIASYTDKIDHQGLNVLEYEAGAEYVFAGDTKLSVVYTQDAAIEGTLALVF